MGFPETRTKAFSPSYLSCLFYDLPFTSTPFCYLLSVFLVFYPSTNGKMCVCRGRCCYEGKTVSCVTSAQLPAFKMLLLSVLHMNHWRPAWEKLPLIRRIKHTQTHTRIHTPLHKRYTSNCITVNRERLSWLFCILHMIDFIAISGNAAHIWLEFSTVSDTHMHLQKRTRYTFSDFRSPDKHKLHHFQPFWWFVNNNYFIDQ